MALTPPVIYSALAANRVAGPFPFLGPNFDTFALGLANGIVAWAVGQPQNVALTGTTTGASGSGIISPLTTRIILAPSIPLVQAGLAGAGIVGPTSVSLSTVVTLGLVQAFGISAQYSGVSAGVGAGQDVSKIVLANPATLTSILLGTLRTMGPGGLGMQPLALGLANGISALLLTGTGAGVVSGVAGPSAAVGFSQSVVV